MLVFPGLRKLISSKIQQLFNTASFDAPLTHSAIPTRAAPGTTGTFTRATTFTWKNNDGYLVTGVAGEIGFVGARRVRNLLATTSENLSNAAWTKGGTTLITTGVTDPLGTTRACTITGNGGDGLAYQAITPPAATGYVAVNSAYIRRRTGTGAVYLRRANNVNTDITSTLTTEWQRFETAAAVPAAGSWYFVLAVAVAGDAIDVAFCQCEDVTAQTTQTAGEYVSVGVPSDWAGTELVTNGTFDTATTGWTALSGAALSVVSGRLRITNGAVAYGGAQQALTTVVGQKYVFSRDFTAGTISTGIVQIGTSSGTADLYAGGFDGAPLSVEFTATTTTTFIQTYVGDTTNGGYADFDNISVKPAYYHGSFVDGVKCFTTDLAGNALPTSYTYDAVSLNGVAGTYVSTPDSVANSDTGSKDLRFKLFNSNWATGGVITNRNSNNVQFDTFGGGGLLRFAVNHSSVTAFATSDVSPTTVFANNTVGWLRVTYDITSGEVLFYTSSDGVAWDQLGTAQSLPTGAIDEPAGVMSLGSDNVGTNPMPTCRIYSAQIYNGIDGTLAVDFDASRYAGGTTLTGSTGETWTLQGNAVIHPTNNPMRGYIAEGARTNLCLQSNAFTTTWLAIGTPAPTQNATGPDGGVTAWTLTDNDGATSEEIYQLLVLTAAAHTLSVFVGKTVGVQSSYPCLLFSPAVGTANFSAVTIDTTNGIATAWTAYTGRTMASGISASCVSYNDDFWRVSLTATATAEAWYVELFPAATSNATQSTGTLDATVTGSAVFYGAQVELGSFASSYIATTTIAVTRNADVLTYSSAGNVSTTSGAMYMETVVAINQVAPQLIVHDALANNYFSMDDGGSAAGALRTLVSSGGAITANFNTGSSSANTVVKRAMSWEVNSVDGCINGTLGVRDTSCAMPLSITTISVGGAGTPVGASTFRNIRAFGRKLSPSELQAVTS